LKNELGRRLIEIQKNIKNNKLEARRETRIDVTEEFIQRDVSTKMFDVDEKRLDISRRTEIAETPKLEKPSFKEKEHDNKSIAPPAIVKREEKTSLMPLWIFSSLLLIAILLLSFLFWNSTDNLNNDIVKLKSQVVKLRTDIAKTNAFVSENKEFVEFFKYPYISIIPMKGLNNSSVERGRLYISFSAGKGLLQLMDMPRLTPGNVFKLWLVSKSGTFPLTSFEPTPEKDYITFSEIPFVMKEEIELFRITMEADASVDVPKGETILFGSFPKAAKSKRRRR